MINLKFLSWIRKQYLEIKDVTKFIELKKLIEKRDKKNKVEIFLSVK
jgi:hypothetical protein